MQTFLPYPNFSDTAKTLDNKRLGKQRVEAWQIYQIVSGKRTTGGWVNHPAVKMWRNYPDALAHYHNEMIDEWVSRGFKNNMPLIYHNPRYQRPPWASDPKFLESHQANLLRKDASFYGQYGWQVDPELPYVWPIA